MEERCGPAAVTLPFRTAGGPMQIRRGLGRLRRRL